MYNNNYKEYNSLWLIILTSYKDKRYDSLNLVT